ncbi:unnamed protein product, partial [Dicrocoelium dendriticum]
MSLTSSLDDDSEYEVEDLLDIRYQNDEPEYLIKWKGHSHNVNSWEPHFNLNCPLLLLKFHQKHKHPRNTVVDIPETKEPYGFDRGLAPDFISMVTKRDDELFFLIK